METPQKNYSCMVIDDDRHAIARMHSLITAHPLLRLIGESDSPLDVLGKWNDKRPKKFDFLFLDVEMPGISGLDFARLTREYYQHLVITTSHSKYAVEAFGVHSNHYLLKPFSTNAFISTVQNMIDRIPRKQETNETIFIKVGKEATFQKVKLSEIILIRALEHYAVIETPSNKYVQHNSMHEIEKSLSSDDRFIRINRSFIISFEHVTAICGNQLVMSNKEKVTIGPTFRNHLLSRLNLL